MKTRRIVGLSIVATALIWFQVAGSLESSRIDAQRQQALDTQSSGATRAGGQAPATARIDRERLMNTVRTLADPKLEGRAAGTPGGLAARAWVVERFKAAGLQPVSGAYVHPFTYARMTMTGKEAGEGANVLGMCVGRDPKLPYFVISAHYDHVGIRDGQIHPGADDNASGVAVMLEIAAFCQKSPFRRSVVFAAFDAEERGLQGARAFLMAPTVPKDRVALNVNLDMVSRSDKREIFVAGTYHYPDLKPPLDAVAKRAPVTVLFGHDKPKTIAGSVDDWTNQSDHGPFHAEKIPFIYFGVEDHADYHKPSDTADKINRDFFGDVAETILDAVIALDQARP
ncbi:MAG TPA: M28 family peptidase [Vicinamibacterales bacterium]|nr:M28 family peptidase [Vicinamibacterales bacterium]